MNIQVKLFALARDMAGTDAVEVLVPDSATVRHVREGIVRACPAMRGAIGHMRIAVDSQYADEATPVTHRSEVALIPPVSGG